MSRLVRPCRIRRASRRSGFSLLEVVLALAILVGSLAVVGELIGLGITHARQARDQTYAQLLCESKLAEITAGIEPLAPVQQAVFLENEEWVYSIEIFPTDELGLIGVHLTVSENRTDVPHPASFSLVRWLRDPGNIPLDSTDDTTSVAGSQESTP